MTVDPSIALNGDKVPKVTGIPFLKRGNVIKTLEFDPEA